MNTFDLGDTTYSVDMLIAYTNLVKPKIESVDLALIDSQLNDKIWGSEKKPISPQDVLNNKKKYKQEYKKIRDANLKYPILVSENGIIIDGYHRLAKSFLNNKKKIKYIWISNDVLKKASLGKTKNINFNEIPNIYNIIVKFVLRYIDL